NHAETTAGVLRIGIELLHHFDDADDLPLVSRMIEEDAIAFAHASEETGRLRVANAVPYGGADLRLHLAGPPPRLTFPQPIGHGFITRSGCGNPPQPNAEQRRLPD